jgi:hypothetical protein
MRSYVPSIVITTSAKLPFCIVPQHLRTHGKRWARGARGQAPPRASPLRQGRSRYGQQDGWKPVRLTAADFCMTPLRGKGSVACDARVLSGAQAVAGRSLMR